MIKKALHIPKTKLTQLQNLKPELFKDGLWVGFPSGFVDNHLKQFRVKNEIEKKVKTIVDINNDLIYQKECRNNKCD
jgi:hypothetical protein